jgi:alpha-galactosidase
MRSNLAAAAAAAAALVAPALAANDGLALKPPMGWRSWNQWQGAINQDLIQAHMAALVDRSRTVNGKPASLADVGYTDAGIDDAWQACGAYGPAPNTLSYHDPVTGAPQVNTTRFPSLRALTDYAHARNLTAGFYSNNCMCHETNPLAGSGYVFAADVNATLAWGFDSIKLDGCGQEENVQLWYDLLSWGAAKAGRKPILVENCHNGGNTPTRDPEWCPFHTYRASTDIAPVYGSILANINTIPALAAANLSYRGCWAYADMLEVGVTNTQNMPSYLSHTEARTHFALWAVTSQPLILGLDLTNATTVDSVWDIVTNTEAVAIDQDYAGHSGTRFYESSQLVPMSPCGWWLPNCSWPSAQYWSKPLSNGDVAVLLVNNGDAPQDLTVSFGDIPLLPNPAGTYAIRDVHAHASLGANFTGAFTAPAVPSRDCAFLRFSLVA